MSTNIKNRVDSINVVRNNNGCSPVKETESVKPASFDKLKITGSVLKNRLLKIIESRQESMTNKGFAVQRIARLPSSESSESLLLNILSKRDLRLSFPALKTLGFTGSEKAFRKLSSLKSLKSKSLIRQRDFAMLLIGYRFQLPGTDKILEQLLKGERVSDKPNTIKLRFGLQQTGDISTLLKNLKLNESGISISRKLAFEIQAGTQQYYLLFNSRLEDPLKWKDNFKSKQLLGLLFLKEKNSTYLSQHYIALANPLKDHIQIIVFRKDGQPLMRAELVYKEENKSFILSNLPAQRTKSSTAKNLRFEKKSFLTVDLSYVRQFKKKNPMQIVNKISYKKK